MSGVLSHSPEQIIQYLLEDLLLGTLPEDDDDWPIFCSRIPEDPDSLIATFGSAPLLQGRQQPTGIVHKQYGTQILVRSHNHATGSAKVQTIDTTLSSSVNQKSITIDDTDYTIQSVSIRSGPIPLGDESPISKRQIFSLNITSSIRQN